MKLPPDLGMSIPSTVRQIGHEMPLKTRWTLRSKRKELYNKECCPSSSSTRIKSLATEGADHNTLRKEFKVKIRMRHPVHWKNWQNWFSDSYFQEKMLLMKFLHLPMFRKALKSLTKMSVPCIKQQPPVQMYA